MIFQLFQHERDQVQRSIEYAKDNIYDIDDLLDMMNADMDVPSQRNEHMTRIQGGRWICYFIADHPKNGRCHYLQIGTDPSGQYADMDSLKYLMTEYGIESELLEEHIREQELPGVPKHQHISIPFN